MTSGGSDMRREPIALCHSGGKDSILALRNLQQSGAYDVVALVTTTTKDYDRVAMHGVRRPLIEQQTDALGLLLIEVEIPAHSNNAIYEERMSEKFRELKARGIGRIAFGDLYLTEIREYRERLLSQLGMECLFPIWGSDTRELMSSFIDDGFAAWTCCVDSKQLDVSFVGREIDWAFLEELPADVDPCGENGEFHTFVTDGPNFRFPVEVAKREIVARDQFLYCDLFPGLSKAGKNLVLPRAQRDLDIYGKLNNLHV